MIKYWFCRYQLIKYTIATDEISGLLQSDAIKKDLEPTLLNTNPNPFS